MTLLAILLQFVASSFDQRILAIRLQIYVEYRYAKASFSFTIIVYFYIKPEYNFFGSNLFFINIFTTRSKSFLISRGANLTAYVLVQVDMNSRRILVMLKTL
jgi:hypothetical protein